MFCRFHHHFWHELNWRSCIGNIVSIVVPIVTSKTNWPELHGNTLITHWSTCKLVLYVIFSSPFAYQTCRYTKMHTGGQTKWSVEVFTMKTMSRYLLRIMKLPSFLWKRVPVQCTYMSMFKSTYQSISYFYFGRCRFVSHFKKNIWRTDTFMI